MTEQNNEWRVTVEPLAVDAAMERHGFGLLDPYLELVWLPVLGPTSAMLLRWIGYRWTKGAQLIDISRQELAAALGVGKSDRLLRSIGRCQQYGAIESYRKTADVLEIRMVPKIPPIRQSQLERLAERGATTAVSYHTHRLNQTS